MPRYFLTAMLLAIVTVCTVILSLRWRMLEGLGGGPRTAFIETAAAGTPAPAAVQPLLSLPDTPPPAAPADYTTTAPEQETVAAQEPQSPPATRPVPRRVNINTASATELETLPGIGPVLADRIVKYRRRSGPFASVERLLDVEGIGPKKLAALKGLAYVESVH